MSSPDFANVPPRPPSPASLQAQLLATEHWGLLAARGTAQSEVLTRITIFLTLVSAGLVTIGVLGQATDFAGPFVPATIGILVFVLAIGLMTQLRVLAVADEDLMYVVAMNRMRAAYVGLAPEIEPAFLAATHDDESGVAQTYSFFGGRGRSHVLGSSFSLIAVVNAVILGLLLGLVLTLATGALWLGILTGALAGLALIVIATRSGYRSYRHAMATNVPLRPRDTAS